MCQEQCCIEQIKGFVLHDCHAEVLARRGLIKVLWEEIIEYHNITKNKEKGGGISSFKQRTLLEMDDNDDFLLLMKQQKKNNGDGDDDDDDDDDDDGGGGGGGGKKEEREEQQQNNNKCMFKLKDDISLHLYISDSPCGDASIYEISQRYANNASDDLSAKNNGLTFTGAKIIVPGHDDDGGGGYKEEKRSDKEDNLFSCTSTICNPQMGTSSIGKNTHTKTSIAREKVQIKSALRLKSGRSNIPEHLRSSSMSCSDKICKWMVLGLQGCGILSRFVSKKVLLSSVVVSKDPRTIDSIGEGGNRRYPSQYTALARGTLERAEAALLALDLKFKDDTNHARSSNIIPKLSICSETFPYGKTMMEQEIIRREETAKNDTKENDLDCVDTCQNKSINNSKKRCIANRNNMPQKRTKQGKSSSCGVSLNWQYSCSNKAIDKNYGIEQVVGGRGIVQRKKPKSASDIVQCASRLSRVSLWDKAFIALSLSHDQIIFDICHQSKKAMCSYQQMKQKYASQFLRNEADYIFRDTKNPLLGWLKSSRDNDFAPHNMKLPIDICSKNCEAFET